MNLHCRMASHRKRKQNTEKEQDSGKNAIDENPDLLYNDIRKKSGQYSMGSDRLPESCLYCFRQLILQKWTQVWICTA